MSENNILNSCLFITLHDRKNDDLKDIVKNFLCFAPEISKKLVKKFEKNSLLWNNIQFCMGTKSRL